MASRWIKSPQDFGAALVFVLIGAAGIYFGRDLAFGTGAKMGPGYFPTVLSWIILLLGVGLGLASLRLQGPPIERLKLRPMLLIVIAVVAFGYLLELAGLAVTAIVLTVVAAYARRSVNLKETLLLAVGLSAFCCAVFIFGLNQPLPLGWWPQ